jgi:hypothetical protein
LTTVTLTQRSRQCTDKALCVQTDCPTTVWCRIQGYIVLGKATVYLAKLKLCNVKRNRPVLRHSDVYDTNPKGYVLTRGCVFTEVAVRTRKANRNPAFLKGRMMLRPWHTWPVPPGHLILSLISLYNGHPLLVCVAMIYDHHDGKCKVQNPKR